MWEILQKEGTLRDKVVENLYQTYVLYTFPKKAEFSTGIQSDETLFCL
ncbi:hypothetical protein LSS_03449 [Leptospira santarosai serovar Shermani str. LT 821]|uniref:Uncharacterized protein n=1 Tax=Leptospira santarosai serovar Shermani str. LT 821 TaxID=758847 RepID=K8Y3N6_9LEPT|nr:hypothetical protein LSS_03449 [Leptospira santarosai serovar Shermani str. LT 821]